MAEDDSRLLEDCLAERPGAWEAFVRRFAPYLAEVCRKTLKRCGRPAGSQEVDDMLQEVFLNFLERDRRALRHYRGKASVAGYLAAIAVHRVLNARPAPPLASPREETGSAPGPTEAVEAGEDLARLRTGMATLPPREALALALQLKGASVKEIGKALGISEDAAAQCLSRARAALAERLGQG